MKTKTSKRLIALFLITVMVIILLSAMSLTAAAAAPNKYTYIRNSPYWFASVVDQFGTSQSVTLLERDGNYIYIEYKKSDGILRRGYMPLADITNPSVVWCDYAEFNPGRSVVTTGITMRYGPSASYGTIATLPSNVGQVTTNPLLVLEYDENSNYAFVQYVSNYSVTASGTQPQYCRGWVLKSQITVNRPVPSSYLGTGVWALIRNKSTGKYLTAIEKSSGSWSVGLQDSTGYSNQQWKIEKYTHSSGAIYYKIKSKTSGLYLQVQDNLPMSGASLILAAKAEPNKAQEFHFPTTQSTLEASYSQINGANVGVFYRIRTRISGSYMCLDVSGNNIVEFRYANTDTQIWSVERLNKYWDNSYSYLPASGVTKTINYYIYNDGTNKDVNKWALIPADDVAKAIQNWDGITSVNGLFIKTSRITDSNKINDAKVKIYAENLGESVTARTIPSIVISDIETLDNESSPKYLNNNWYASHLKLNSYDTVDNSSISFADINFSAKPGTVCHEFGHALKLKHPYGEYNSSNHSDQVVYSVMNQGVYEATSGFPESKVSYTPTDYDRQTLLNKWGD